MSCYRVTFFKDLLSSDGHPFRCIQRVFDVRRARSADRAVEAAELRYERLHHSHDWTLHADGLELEADGRKIDHRPRL
jgi:hypothetical protein